MKDQFNNAVGPQVRGSAPKAGKLIPALVVVSLAAGLQSATQFFAHDFRYQAALGRHFEHVYAPWSILQWAGQWYRQYPDAIMRAGSVGMIVTTLGLLGLAVTRMVLANSSRLNPYLHGSARWANLKDIQASGLLPRPRTFWQALTGARPAASAGVYVGAWLDARGHSHYLRHRQGGRPGGADPPVVGRERRHHRPERRALGLDRRLAPAACEKPGAATSSPLRPAAASAGTPWTKSGSAPNTRLATCRTSPR
jgi:hypothetical protein